MKKKTSLKDIANKFGVSKTSVSFIINGKAEEKKISKELTEKILAYTKEIGYTPNSIAKSLRTGKSKLLVFMVEDISNTFFSQIARIVENEALKKGYKIIFCSNDNDNKKSKELIKLFVERQVDGFLITPSSNIQDTINELKENNIPVVLFDRYFKEIDVPYVVLDNYKASFDATSQLIQNGFKNILFVTLDVNQSQMIDRLEGYTKAIDQHKNLNHKILKIKYKNSSIDTCRKSISDFLQKDQDFDSILFSTNYLAICAIAELQIIRPQLLFELGMITFDDNYFFQIMNPKISSVQQPLEKMGKELMNIMLSQLSGEAYESKVIPADFVERESSIKD